MLLLPYAVDVPFERRPFMNWLLVGSVVLAYIFQFQAFSSGNEDAVETFVLEGWGLQGLIGHMWLHGDIFHLGGNMLFLWLFGNAVCAKVGNLKYLPIYLLLGLGAAAAHLIFDGAPAIGASGAINGIVGMFLVFFWENEVDCLFGICLVYRKISVSSFWLIGLWLIFDIWGAVSGGGQVAYYAHLGGFFAGVAVAVALLKLNLVTMYRDEQSLVELFEQWRQDRQDAKLQAIARARIDKTLSQPLTSVKSASKGSTIAVSRNESVPIAVPASPAAVPKQPVMLRFKCTCGRTIKAAMEHAGKKGRCPQCRQVIIVPVPRAKGY